MDNIPVSIQLIFIPTVLVTLVLFYLASRKSKITLTVLLVWLSLQALLAINGFYTVTNTTLPRFVLMVAPVVLTIVVLFLTQKGRNYLDSFNPGILTYLHAVRIPVEIVLYLLFLEKLVPQLMTFEGRNFDILAGISAPVIAYYGYTKMKLSKKILIAWNIICLALLFNIVIHGILAAPGPIQKIACDQPNMAVLYFPTNWLPSFIVQAVFFSHLVCIRQLVKRP